MQKLKSENLKVQSVTQKEMAHGRLEMVHRNRFEYSIKSEKKLDFALLTSLLFEQAEDGNKEND